MNESFSFMAFVINDLNISFNTQARASEDTRVWKRLKNHGKRSIFTGWQTLA